MVHDSSEHEEEVAQAVQVSDQVVRHVDTRLVAEVDDQALGPSADRPGQMDLGRGGRPAGQDELREGRQFSFEAVDLSFEPTGVSFGNGVMKPSLGVGVGQGSTHGEEFVLDQGDESISLGVESLASSSQAEHGIKLIDGPVGINPGVVLKYTAITEEAGCAVVSGLRINLQEMNLLRGRTRTLLRNIPTIGYWQLPTLY